MATDASRRWLDNSGIWSCRIKLPADNQRHHPHSDETTNNPRSQRDLTASSNLSSAVAMDIPLESTSPSSRRNKGKLAEAIQSMSNLNNSMESLDLPTDPDAQATVTDFLDFTEYLPSDMIRSLTLIGNLDHAYCESSANVNDLTKKYGDLPSLPRDEKPDPTILRADISQNLADAVGARVSAHAEACRMAENVDRHYNRAKNILAKLQDMMEKYPDSREPSPVPQQKQKSTARAPKITLRIAAEAGNKVRKHRAPRITVPGEVLAPYELDYESYGSESEDEIDEIPTPRATSAISIAPIATSTSKIKLKIPKPKKEKKEKGEKTPRPPRPPGTMGTNVHSSVAGISTSNALALLQPPPADAVEGSEHKPWLQLTAWELANLRKRMKKNAVWSPSDTMIARELKLLGRGIEAYRSAKAKAEANGQVFDQPVPPQLNGETVHAEGAISVEALQDVQLSNRGMKLNEAKKLKKEKEFAKLAEEAEQSALKLAAASNTIKDLFKDDKKSAKTPAKTPSKPAVNKKRKREPSVEGDVEEKPVEKTAEGEAAKPNRPLLKRKKTETPVPVPMPIIKSQTPLVESTASVTSESAPSRSTGTPAESLPVPASPPKKPITPILPPTKEARKPIKKEVKKVEPTPNTRPQRTAAAKTPTPVPEPLPSRRPTSSRSNGAHETTVATAAIDRPHRANTARNTPVPTPVEPRQNNKRKRPAPGPVAPSSEGSTAVTVGKRSAATRKKGTKKEKREGSTVQEIYDEIDDEGNIIDPDEPRYCVCNRVSFGTMIGCENQECEKEWFHIECVGLTDIPPRTTKWYCPECRVTLGIGEKGEVSARGKKK